MMFNQYTFNIALIVWILIGLIVFGVLFKVTAPYGKFFSKKWGAMVNNRLGWIVMEAPPLLLFSFFFFWGNNDNNLVCLAIYSIWMMHYLHRDLIFPFRLKTRGKKMPAAIMSFGLIYNFLNAFFNGYYLGFYADYNISWFTDYRFVIGVIVFITGFIINIQSDTILFRLRKETADYKIPYGGLYRFVSCPNYLGEIMEWLGFAILSWSLAGFSFFVWTTVNLLPRAFSHHEWYKKNFPEYPANRKAIVPFII
ncbi:MAG TPA: DUF1295 domain-containing protein [Bacteroidales bacterium]|nr:DUF1295 domain-containing protein [Bacteroidales bacterium]